METSRRRRDSAHFEFCDVFTAVNVDFESNESFTTDEAPLQVSFKIHLTSDEFKIIGIVVRVLNRSNELSNRRSSPFCGFGLFRKLQKIFHK
jgi:hypothetical protein